MKRLVAALAGALCLVGGWSVAALEDTEPPAFLGVTVTPTTVDAGGQITVTLQATDNLSGVCVTNCQVNGIGISPTQVRFTSPSGNQFIDVLFTPAGTNTYEGTATIGTFAESGDWHVAYALLVDNAGNSQSYPGDGQAAFTVRSNTSDIEPPMLLGLSVLPNVVDAGGQITVTLQATDNLSGVCVTNCQVNGIGISPTQVRFTSPSGNQFIDVLFTPAGGATYTGTATIGPFAESGVWRTAYVLLVDNAGNSQSANSDAQFTVRSQTSDIEPPVFRKITVKPRTVKAGGQITVGLQATDNLSGVCVTNCQVNGIGISPTHARFTSPSGNQFIDVLFTASGRDSYTGTAAISPFAEAGGWQLAYVYLVDNAGNSHQYPGNTRPMFTVLNPAH